MSGWHGPRAGRSIARANRPAGGRAIGQRPRHEPNAGPGPRQYPDRTEGRCRQRGAGRHRRRVLARGAGDRCRPHRHGDRGSCGVCGTNQEKNGSVALCCHGHDASRRRVGRCEGHPRAHGGPGTPNGVADDGGDRRNRGGQNRQRGTRVAIRADRRTGTAQGADPVGTDTRLAPARVDAARDRSAVSIPSAARGTGQGRTIPPSPACCGG